MKFMWNNFYFPNSFNGLKHQMPKALPSQQPHKLMTFFLIRKCNKYNKVLGVRGLSS